jgi:hypothetical protein
MKSEHVFRKVSMLLFEALLKKCLDRSGTSTPYEDISKKFPDWPPGARTANGTVLCLQSYHYFVSRSNEFCRHNLCVASQRVFIFVVVYFVMDSVRKLLDTPSYLSVTLNKPVFLLPQKFTPQSKSLCWLSINVWLSTAQTWYQSTWKSVNLFTRYVTGICQLHSIPGGGWEFFSKPPRPERLWGPPSLLSNGYQGLFPLG